MPKFSLKIKGKRLPKGPIMVHIKPVDSPSESQSQSTSSKLPRLPSKYARVK